MACNSKSSNLPSKKSGLPALFYFSFAGERQNVFFKISETISLFKWGFSWDTFILHTCKFISLIYFFKHFVSLPLHILWSPKNSLYKHSYIRAMPSHMVFIMHTLYINRLHEACSNTVQQVFLYCKHRLSTKRQETLSYQPYRKKSHYT